VLWSDELKRLSMIKHVCNFTMEAALYLYKINHKHEVRLQFMVSRKFNRKYLKRLENKLLRTSQNTLTINVWYNSRQLWYSCRRQSAPLVKIKMAKTSAINYHMNLYSSRIWITSVWNSFGSISQTIWYYFKILKTNIYEYLLNYSFQNTLNTWGFYFAKRKP
jgi:hypothetical protein